MRSGQLVYESKVISAEKKPLERTVSGPSVFSQLGL